MNNFKRVTVWMLLVICISLLMIPVAADAYAEHEGLQVSVKMDKEYYEEGEAITATILVLNTNAEPVTIVNLEQLIPEGYVLAEDSEVATKNVVLEPDQTLELKVTFVGDPANPDAQATEGTFWDKLFYGETLGIPNIILVVIVVVGIIIFMALT